RRRAITRSCRFAYCADAATWHANSPSFRNDGEVCLRFGAPRRLLMAKSIHESQEDPRNRDILIYVNGAMKPRSEAVVSVFDSGFVLGDGVWEGLRVSNGHPAFLEQHLDRLYEGAKAIALDIGLDRDALTRAMYATLDANGMKDGAHVRLMITRGVKR